MLFIRRLCTDAWKQRERAAENVYFAEQSAKLLKKLKPTLAKKEEATLDDILNRAGVPRNKKKEALLRLLHWKYQTPNETNASQH